MSNGEEMLADARQDLEARVVTDHDSLEQIRESKARLAQESEALSEQLDLLRMDGNSKEVRGLKRRLGELEKLYVELCREEDAIQEQLEYVSEKQRRLQGGCVPLAPGSDAAEYGGLAGALFSMAQRLDEQRIAEHAACRASVSIPRLVRIAGRVPKDREALFRRYEELHGEAASGRPLRTPYTGTEAACYDFRLYDAANTGKEAPVLFDDALDGLCVRDADTGDAVLVDAKSYGGKLLLETVFDAVVAAGDLPAGIRERLPAGDAGAYRVVERAIPAGSPLFIQGEVYLRDGDLHVRRTFDRTHAPVVAAGTQSRVTRPRTRRVLIGAAVAVPMLALAVFALLSSL